MKRTTKAAAGLGVAVLAVQAGAVLAAAETPDAGFQDKESGAAFETCAVEGLSSRVSVPAVTGSFSFTQSEVASNDWLFRNLAEGSRYLCGATSSAAASKVDAGEWLLTVDGNVGRTVSATVSEVAQDVEMRSVVMGCSCLGNPADGRASANALVKGLPVDAVVALAEPEAAANTVVFTSADGYQVALPLEFLDANECLLVFDVNGSELEESVGGTNQLWLGSTPASYFARDVVGITVETRGVPPVDPLSAESQRMWDANLPNVGVLLGGEVA